MEKTSTLRRKSFTYWLLVGSLWLFTSVYVWAQTVYVTPTGAGQQTGADWINALPGSALQPQLAGASAGTVFRLAGGMYKPTTTGDRSVSFSIPSGVQVYGGYAGSGATPGQRVDFASSDQPSSTTLSGDIDNDNQLDAENTNNVVRFSKANEQTRLDGVVITGGYANQPLANPELFSSSIGGGGIYNDAYRGTSSPTLENCSLIGNYSSGRGGGLFNDNRSGSASINLTNTDFINNTAALGGAVYQYVSSPIGDFKPSFTNCRFLGNSAGSGGGVYTDVTIEFSGAPTIVSTYINCSFVGNTAGSRGGALYTDARGTTSLLALSSLINCTLSGNTAAAGGALLNTATPLFTRFVLIRSQADLTNCILWNNGGTNAVVNETYNQPVGVTSAGQGSTESKNGVLEAGVVLTSGSANQFITASPFVNEQSLQLSPCSPAVNTGLNSAYTGASGPATDLAGNPRLFPTGGTIDAGAYESQQTSATPIAITQQPVSQSSVQAGATVTVPVGLSGPATNYAWYKDDVLVTGQKSATLTLTNVQPIQSGSYRLVVNTPCDSVTTDAFNLVVTPVVSDPLVSSLTATTLSLCAGSQTQLTAQVSGGTRPYTYSWQTNGNATLSNAVDNTIQLRANTAQVLSVSVLVTDATSATTSANLTITVNNLPNASFTGLPASLCQAANSVNLTAATPGGSFAGAGVEGNTFYPSRVQVGGPYAITYSVSSQGCSSTSTQSISVLAAPAAPGLVTLSGQSYAGNKSQVEVPQYSGTVTLVSSGCSGGTVSWSGPGSQSGTGTISVPTATVGTFVYSARCAVGGCESAPASATVVVKQVPLQFASPSFDCATNKLTLRTTGGNGQPVEYQIPSVTQGWTTTNQFLITAKQAKKGLKLNARQRKDQGFDKADLDYDVPSCPGARVAVEAELVSELTVSLLGNPVEGKTVVVEIRGAEGYPLHMQLTDLTGRLIIEQTIERAASVEQPRLLLDDRTSGLLLLQVSTPLKSKSVKVLKVR